MKQKFFCTTMIFLLFIMQITAAKEIQFEFEYSFDVKITRRDSGKDLKIWFPIPITDTEQLIREVKIHSPFPYKITRENKYGNKMVFINLEKTRPGIYPLKMIVSGKRAEVQTSQGISFSKSLTTPAVYKRFLENQKLTYIDASITNEARRLTANLTTVSEKAAALYNNVLEKMQYDKTVQGWGTGSTRFACDVGKGNCTDFHSYFNSLARAIKIPSRFQIGFPFPGKSGKVKGYHCWAKYYDARKGWVPVDISEADKHPEKKDYFFGSIDAHRVRFSEGREFDLKPRQNSGPVNFFIYPHLELQGKKVSIAEKNFHVKYIQ
ncbi:transglutaminase-like domain-containing protein [Candidatus Riflebacteria bacterium]